MGPHHSCSNMDIDKAIDSSINSVENPLQKLKSSSTWAACGEDLEMIAVSLPSTNLVKEMARESGQRQNLSKVAAKDALEITHLKILKWVLGVQKKTNNNFCYGDT